eukprot:6159766-Pyramimonas_sp.AAC.1
MSAEKGSDEECAYESNVSWGTERHAACLKVKEKGSRRWGPKDYSTVFEPDVDSDLVRAVFQFDGRPTRFVVPTLKPKDLIEMAKAGRGGAFVSFCVIR